MDKKKKGGGYRLMLKKLCGGGAYTVFTIGLGEKYCIENQNSKPNMNDLYPQPMPCWIFT